ncbi:MAG: T9SS type A sorting domain-containing protein [Saprospiraceae bacterium]|nr:T9SS type A sorting domain-containing protein [Lewinellaceae bacterium]MBP6810833.1 T9SS type A sorting domain-containing protein [Saprospiraceae bacterium]
MKSTANFCLAIFFALPICLHAQLWPTETIRSGITGAWTRAADFDNDNDPDILVQSGDTIYWYENLLPGWTPHIIDLTFYNSKFDYVDVLDLDGDGDTDILKFPASDFADPLTWNENKSNGTEWELHQILPDVNCNWMQSSWGDLDGDGDVDLVVPEADFINPTPLSSIYWLENTGDGDAWTKHPLLPGSYLYSSVADLDGDGDLDIACDEGSAGILWLENKLPNTVWIQHPVVNNGDFHLVGACVDLNGDGAADIATAMQNGGIAYFANPGWGKVNINSAPQLYFGVFGDVDGDGDTDVPYGGWGNVPQALGWAENQNNGANWVKHNISTAVAIQRIPTGLADIDDDGDLDLVSLTFDYNTGLGSALWSANPKISVSISNPKTSEELSFISVWPNPFSVSTTIRYELNSANNVSLCVYDLLGRQVRTLHRDRQDAGIHEAIWDGKLDNGDRAPSAVYFLRIATENGAVSRMMVME